jgi:hypothetical protein
MSKASWESILLVSLDGGESWNSIADGLPNAGTFLWTPSHELGTPGPAPTFSALLSVTAHDAAGNYNIDQSDSYFAIFDLATLSARRSADRAHARRDAESAEQSCVVSYALPALHHVARVGVRSAGPRGRGAGRWCTIGRHVSHAMGAVLARRWCGVYFVRFRTPQKVLTRRLVVTR